jgi:hypothetical protein
MPNCIFIDCTKKSAYNYKNENIRLYCSEHKENYMINLDEKSKYCIEENCSTKATYNFENIKKGIYCKIHKKNNMINVTGKRWNHPLLCRS